jgi:hypothetical protein
MAQHHHQYEYTRVSDVTGKWHSITTSMNTHVFVMLQDNGTASPPV